MKTKQNKTETNAKIKRRIMKVETHRWTNCGHIGIVKTIGYDIICLLKSIICFVFLLFGPTDSHIEKRNTTKQRQKTNNVL